MKTTRASLDITLVVSCPECEHLFDLLTDTDLNDEGYLLEETITDKAWKRDEDERLECTAGCPECGEEFNVKGVNW
jgi:hypothetical protein